MFHQDVRKHYNAESRVWMTYRSGVYDVTDFIARHPGAQNIMLAAGGDVQPFWDIYSVHKGNDQVENLGVQFEIFRRLRPFMSIQGPAKRWSPGCANAAGKGRQK